MENYLGGMMHRNLNEWEKYDWAIVQRLPHFSGFASVIGSFILIVTIICSKRRRSHPYHRLMLGMSCYDIFMSFFMGMAVWAHPAETCWDPNDCAKSGTVQTCTAFGFFYQLGSIAIPLYNVALATYIAFATRDHFSKNPSSYRRFDFVFHLVILVVGVGQAIVPVILDDYNPYDWLCMVVPVNYDEESGSYLRGNLETMIIYAYLNLIVVVVASCYVTAAMIYTFCSVFSKSDPQSRGTGFRVAIMGLLYTIPFYITWIIPSIFFFVFLDDWYKGFNADITFFTRYFGLVWTAVFLPMQGFFNLFVYFVPICLKVVGVDETYNRVPREASVYDSDGPDAPRESRADDSAGADASTMYPTLYDQMC